MIFNISKSMYKIFKLYFLMIFNVQRIFFQFLFDDVCTNVLFSRKVCMYKLFFLKFFSTMTMYVQFFFQNNVFINFLDMYKFPKGMYKSFVSKIIYVQNFPNMYKFPK